MLRGKRVFIQHISVGENGPAQGKFASRQRYILIFIQLRVFVDGDVVSSTRSEEETLVARDILIGRHGLHRLLGKLESAAQRLKTRVWQCLPRPHSYFELDLVRIELCIRSGEKDVINVPLAAGAVKIERHRVLWIGGVDVQRVKRTVDDDLDIGQFEAADEVRSSKGSSEIRSASISIRMKTYPSEGGSPLSITAANFLSLRMRSNVV